VQVQVRHCGKQLVQLLHQGRRQASARGCAHRQQSPDQAAGRLVDLRRHGELPPQDEHVQLARVWVVEGRPASPGAGAEGESMYSSAGVSEWCQGAPARARLP